MFGLLGERRGTTAALRDVTLAVERGEVLALLGANGAGKTTLLKLICTMLLPDSGTLRVAGFDAERQPQQVTRRVGFALAHERSFYPRLTARENLNFYAVLEDVPRSQRPARIARALVKQPAVLLLDEPTRSIDPEGSEQLWHSVRQLAAAGTTVVVATHDFEEAVAIGDSIAVLDHGALAAFTHTRALGSAAALREFYFRNVRAEAAAEFATVARGARLP